PGSREGAAGGACGAARHGRTSRSQPLARTSHQGHRPVTAPVGNDPETNPSRPPGWCPTPDGWALTFWHTVVTGRPPGRAEAHPDPTIGDQHPSGGCDRGVTVP